MQTDKIESEKESKTGVQLESEKWEEESKKLKNEKNAFSSRWCFLVGSRDFVFEFCWVIKMHRCLTTSQIQQELSRLCDTQEDVSGDESFDDLSMNLSENLDAEFQPEQVTSSSDDSVADFPDTGNTFTVNLRRGRGVSRRSISGGRTGRGGRSSRTTSGPEVGILRIASDGTEWTCISPNAFEVGRCSQQNILREISGPTPYAKRYIGNNKPIST